MKEKLNSNSRIQGYVELSTTKNAKTWEKIIIAAWQYRTLVEAADNSMIWRKANRIEFLLGLWGGKEKGYEFNYNNI